MERNRVRGFCIMVVFIILVVTAIFIYGYDVKYKDTPTNAVKTSQLSDSTLRQIDELGKPTITPFQPDENFTVVESSDRGIVITNGFANFPLTTIVVKRMKDGAIFRVATEFHYDSSVKVKIFKIFWEQNNAINASFLLALPLDEAAHFSRFSAKNDLQ